jgi:hypothetical protein
MGKQQQQGSSSKGRTGTRAYASLRLNRNKIQGAVMNKYEVMKGMMK